MIYVIDLAERAGATFVQAAVATVPVTVVGADWSTVKTVAVTAAIAGGSAALSLIKGVVAQRFGNPTSASLSKNV
jgi:hypothetical protein